MLNYINSLSPFIQSILFGIISGIVIFLYCILIIILRIINTAPKIHSSTKKSRRKSVFTQQLNKNDFNIDKANIISKKILSIYFCIIVYSTIFLCITVFCATLTNTKIDDSDQTSFINEISNSIYTIAGIVLSVTLVCASLKKDYYIVFNSFDVGKKYNIGFLSFNLIAIMFLTAINQCILYTTDHVTCIYSTLVLFLAVILISTCLLIVTIRLLFQNSKYELKLLDSLYLKKKENVFITDDNNIGVDENIKYLCNKYLKSLIKLDKRCSNQLNSKITFKYSDISNLNKKKIPRYLLVFLPIIFTATLTLSILSNTLATYFIEKEFLLLTYIVTQISSFLMLIIALFITSKTKHRHSLNTIMFNQNIYFITKKKSILYYFDSPYIPNLYFRIGHKWLRSLTNIYVFFKIYTNSNDTGIQLERAKNIINLYKKHFDLSLQRKSPNQFIILPLILFMYHSYISFEDKNNVLKLTKNLNICWTYELEHTTKSILREFFEDTAQFQNFLKDSNLQFNK